MMSSNQLHDLHRQRARELESGARAAASTSQARAARRLELLARIFDAGADWTGRRARRYACRARSLRTARAL